MKTSIALAFIVAWGSFLSEAKTIGWTDAGPQTQMHAVCPPDGFGGTGYTFSTHCVQVQNAWNSMAADTVRNQMIALGGGHRDYAGNELYKLQVNPDGSLGSWQRVTDPTLPISPPGNTSCPLTLSPSQDPSVATPALCQQKGKCIPNVRHTYDTLAHIPTLDSMFMAGGTPSCSAGGFKSDRWLLDLSSVVQPGSTEVWTRLDATQDLLTANPGWMAVYNPLTQQILAHDLAALFSIDPVTGATTKLVSNPVSYLQTAEFDPVDNLWISAGVTAGTCPPSGSGCTGKLWQIDLKQTPPVVADISPASCAPIMSIGYPGLAWDSVQKLLVGWAGGSTVYLYDPVAQRCVIQNFASGPTFQPVNTGTFGKFRYFPGPNVFVLCNGVDANCWTLRLTLPKPQITGIVVSSISETSAVVNWTTDIPSTSAADFGTALPYNRTQSDPQLTTNHQISLTGLTVATAYHFRVRSANSSGLESASADQTFATIDQTPPSVSLLQPMLTLSLVANITDNVGVIGAQLLVDGQATGSCPSFLPCLLSLPISGSHTYQIVATDAAGNVGVSPTASIGTTVTTTGPTPTPTPTPTPAPTPTPGLSFPQRCASPGVVQCLSFDDRTATLSHVDPPCCPDAQGNPQPLQADVVNDVPGVEGAGALRFTVPSQTGANTSGEFSLNFSPDLSFQVGEGQEYWLQFRVRYSDVMLSTNFTGSNGFKTIVIGEGDRPGQTPASSCTQLDHVWQDIQQNGHPRTYHTCNVFEEVQGTCLNGAEVDDQPRTAAGDNSCGCPHYGDRGLPQSDPPCVTYRPNQWQTWQEHLLVGHWNQPDTLEELWIANDGEKSRLAFSHLMEIQNSDTSKKIGKVWLLPYQTGKDPTQVTSTGFVWYDSLIISKQRIPDVQ